jgi:hypothetical protein
LRRALLQRHATTGAKRRVRKLSGKSRFRKQANHSISMEIVATAKRSRGAILDGREHGVMLEGRSDTTLTEEQRHNDQRRIDRRCL